MQKKSDSTHKTLILLLLVLVASAVNISFYLVIFCGKFYTLYSLLGAVAELLGMCSSLPTIDRDVFADLKPDSLCHFILRVYHCVRR